MESRVSGNAHARFGVGGKSGGEFAKGLPITIGSSRRVARP